MLNGLGEMPLAIPECILLSAILTVKSKLMHPLKELVIVMVSYDLDSESKQITIFGLANNCLYFCI